MSHSLLLTRALFSLLGTLSARVVVVVLTCTWQRSDSWCPGAWAGVWAWQVGTAAQVGVGKNSCSSGF